MIHSSKFIQDKYGYNRVTSSYINGAVYDVSIIVCLSTGLVLVKTILYTVHTAKTLTFFFNLLFNQRFVIFGLTDGNVILIYSLNENNLNVSKNRKIMHFIFTFPSFCNAGQIWRKSNLSNSGFHSLCSRYYLPCVFRVASLDSDHLFWDLLLYYCCTYQNICSYSDARIKVQFVNEWVFWCQNNHWTFAFKGLSSKNQEYHFVFTIFVHIYSWTYRKNKSLGSVFHLIYTTPYNYS